MVYCERSSQIEWERGLFECGWGYGWVSDLRNGGLGGKGRTLLKVKRHRVSTSAECSPDWVEREGEAFQASRAHLHYHRPREDEMG